MFNANRSGLVSGEPGRKFTRPPQNHPAHTDDYVRPADWLAMPDVAEGTQACTMLVAVFNNDNNFIAFRFFGAYNVDWGDGTSENVASGTTAQHQYYWDNIAAGTLTSRGYRQAIITVTPQAGQNLTYISFSYKHSQTNLVSGYSTGLLEIVARMPNIGASNLLVSGSASAQGLRMLERIVFLGAMPSLTSLSGAFSSNYALRVISIDTTYVTNFSSVFSGCTSLVSVPTLNTSAATAMDSMFNNCYNLVTIPLMSTGSVQNMSNMFSSCYSLVTIPLLSTGNVQNMSNMFYGCSSLVTIPLLDTSSVAGNGSSLTGMYSMFSGCTSLVSVPLLNTSKVQNMSNMFYGCSRLVTIPLLDTSSVAGSSAANTGMYSMFYGCSSITSIPLLNTSNVQNMNSMFYNCKSLVEIPKLVTTSVIDMSIMFYSCYSLLTIPSLNTGNVQNMYGMFSYCYSMTTIPLLDTHSVAGNGSATSGMASMFSYCSSLVSVPLLNTVNVQNMYGMFYYCSSLVTIPLLDTSSVAGNGSSGTGMYNMFNACTSLASVPALSTGNVKNMNGMFNSCYSLTRIPTFNTSAVIDIGSIVYGSHIMKFEVSSAAAVTTTSSAFSSCEALEEVLLPGITRGFSVASCALSRAAIVALFNSLGTASGAQTVVVTGNWGTQYLSAGNLAIATGKGWTVTV